MLWRRGWFVYRTVRSDCAIGAAGAALGPLARPGAIRSGVELLTAEAVNPNVRHSRTYESKLGVVGPFGDTKANEWIMRSRVGLIASHKGAGAIVESA